jgi:beta-galactosidase
VQLHPDRPEIDANGEDISIITVAVVDEKGRVVPVANHPISFELEGPGRILGVGNGNPSSHEPDTLVPTVASRSLPISGWRYKKGINAYDANIPEVAEKFDDSGWQSADVNLERGPLGLHDKAVFRTRFQVSAKDLAMPVVELWFGKIDGGVAVFLNGQKIGGAGDSRAASVYDVKKLLRAGENVLAVTLANYGPAAGLNKGVALRVQDNPAKVAWSRSVFNGLAQIIVQSSKEPGTLKLTARAKGLSSMSVPITTRAVAVRAALP